VYCISLCVYVYDIRGVVFVVLYVLCLVCVCVASGCVLPLCGVFVLYVWVVCVI